MATQPQRKPRSASTAPAKRAAAPAPTPSRREQASSGLREAVDGREDEFWGLGFLAVGILLALGIWFTVAGPLGRGALDSLDQRWLKPSALPAARQDALRQAFASAVKATYPAGDAPAYSVRFAAITQVAETITCSGVITEKFEEGGERRVRLQLTTANAEGQIKLAGDAVVAWP